MTQNGMQSSLKRCTMCQRSFERAIFRPGRSRCRECHRSASRLSVWKSTLKHKYGISLEIYQAMYDDQRGRCHFCNVPRLSSGRGRLAVDHDHTTGFVRGLLCRPCNAGWVDRYRRLPKDLQDSPRTNAYLRRGSGDYIEGIRQRLASGGVGGLLSDKPDHELFAELQNEIFGNRTLPGNSADLIREAREIRDAEIDRALDR